MSDNIIDRILKTHNPPNFTLYGRQKPTLAISPDLLDTKIPKGWINSPSYKSQSELKDFHKTQRLPDPSYSLTPGPGISPQEYFVASRFDFDKDRRLNTQEKKRCFEELKKGFEQQFNQKVKGKKMGPHGISNTQRIVSESATEESRCGLTLTELKKQRKNKLSELYQERLKKLMENAHYAVKEIDLRAPEPKMEDAYK